MQIPLPKDKRGLILFFILLFILMSRFSVAGEVKITVLDGEVNDYFGNSVSISGDYAIVGAERDDVGAQTQQGSAYIYLRDGSAWNLQAQLNAGAGVAFDQFGCSVSISGDYAIIGALGDNSGQGAAYVFKRTGVNWNEQDKLTAGDGATLDYFGWGVSISGDYAIVGAISDYVDYSNQGSAYIFVRSGESWSEQDKLTATGGALDDYFGRTVSISGDYAIVGADRDDVGANSNQGSAYVFLRSGSTWSQQAQLNASDGAADDWFGYSVSISGDYALVGAIYNDVDYSNQGSAYIFLRSGINWNQQAKLTTTGAAAGDQFGYSTSISGNYALVGAPLVDFSYTNQGAVCAFLRSGSSWAQTAKQTASDGAASDYFGWSVSVSGDYAITGANYDDVNYSNQGSAYIYNSGSDLSLPVELTSFTAAAGDGEVDLQWVTQSEVNNLGFILERATDHQGPFQEIASYIHNPQLQGQGNSNQATNYHYSDRFVINDITYYYRLSDIAVDGSRSYHQIISVTPNENELDLEQTSSRFYLYQNYPNPFNPETLIRYTIANQNPLVLKITNMLGQEVRTLVNEVKPPGIYEVKWDGRDNSGQQVTSGVYMYKLQAGQGFVQVRKMVYLP